ncbi:hypothetical protein SCHPADRAFT_358050 [Schizopora paradoxa]|uniref:Uncharacterized protein n=1 Tax=Schizopora paradoxa TaxID=27342 RepID=A0A0H2RNH5_9AGAM|nr:hypothetical protein SCHPADRAFT_358050 [Schizopora paradoxa]
MDVDSKPYKVAKYTLISCLAGGSLTATYEWTRAYRSAFKDARSAKVNGTENARTFQGPLGGTKTRGPILLLAGSAALNSGFIAFGFFSLREYLISPTLQGLRATSEDFRADRVTWSDLRMKNVIDSSIAGAMVGAAINAFKRGAAGMPAGAITAGIACSLVQVIVNEANIQRVKYASSLPGAIITPSRQDGSTESHPTHQSVSEAKPKKSFLDHALRMIGVSRATDEEYLQKLKVQRERLLRRIDELEKEESETFSEDSISEDKTNS